MQGHAEIAGAGLAGLAAAVSLAQRGWTVAVHEAGPELREIGAGLYVWENGVRVLEALGVYQDVAGRAHAVPHFDVVDERFRRVQRLDFSDTPGNRLRIVLRTELHRALVERARGLGVTISTSSRVVEATPDARLRFADGSERTADLVVGADGVNSAVRDGLGLLKRKRSLIDGAIRLLVPRSDIERTTPDHQNCVEYWNGSRRILYTPAGPDHVYLCFTARNSDEAAKRLPVDVDLWRRDFPRLAEQLERIGPETSARWDRFALVSVHGWSRGRAAIVGDAVHAQPPNLGQGAGLAMSMGLALGHVLGEATDVEQGLARWEASERDIVAHTQRWTWLWGAASSAVPHQLQRTRSGFVRFVAGRRWVARNVERTARHVPTGTLGFSSATGEQP